ncbi:hypothetical protein C5616_26035 [Vibrio anguillarum]|nr:hypothetical protein [Vibrio anguillarum]
MSTSGRFNWFLSSKNIALLTNTYFKWLNPLTIPTPLEPQGNAIITTSGHNATWSEIVDSVR